MDTSAFRVKWFIEGEYFGEGPFPRQCYIPVHNALFCNMCGRVWAMQMVNCVTRYYVINRPCARHGAGFVLPFNECWITVAPEEVLRYEILKVANLKFPDLYEVGLMSCHDSRLPNQYQLT